jgi:hypothetical protein
MYAMADKNITTMITGAVKSKGKVNFNGILEMVRRNIGIFEVVQRNISAAPVCQLLHTNKVRWFL